MRDKGLNLNSLLLAVVIGLGSWGLSEIIALDRTTASFISGQMQINQARDEQMKEIKVSLASIESRINRLERVTQ